MEIVLGLLAVLIVMGMATGILYCLVYGYTTLDELGMFDSVKKKGLRAFLTVIAEIAIFAGIIGVSYLAGGYALKLITELIAK